jgi:hypothetical protein
VPELTDDERPVFIAWARSRTQFIPRMADGQDIGRRSIQRESLDLIGGTITIRRVVQSVDELVDRWRSLGRPDAPIHNRRAPGLPIYRGGTGRIGQGRRRRET